MDSHNPRSLHIYVEMPNTLLKDGVLSPMLAPEENLQHYADRAGSTKKEDILAYLESTFKGRSRSISVLTEPIPDNANKKLLEFRNSCQHVVLPPVEKLINAGIVEEIRSGNRPYNVVDKMDYSERIDWNRSLSGLLFKNIPHYMIVLTSGKIPPSFLSNEREIRQNSILRTAIPLYKDDGSNQWPHISRVLTEGYKYCDMLKMEISDTLYAAILFHDCAKGEGKSKKDHGVESARKAKPLIKQFFDSKDLDIVLTAISEHNIPKPASSKIGELLKAADANILDIPWFLNKLYWKRKEKGMSDEEAFSECLEVIQKGYLTYDRPNMYQPKYWTMRYGKDIPRVRKEIEELTVDKVKRIVKDYIKKYGTRSAFESLINIKDEDMEKGIESLEAEIGMKIEPSTERFYIKDEDIEKEVLALPRISRNNLKNVVKPGDLILVYPRKFSGLMGKLSYKLNTLGQQSVFSSIKMIGLNNKVIGYGVKEIGSRIDEVSVNSLADRFSGIVVLRHKNMTPSIATKIYNWVYDKFLKKIPYGYTDILKAVIHRMFKVVGMVFDVETMEDQIQSLYCSTILHLAYKKFNLDTGLNKLGLGDMDIFPKDFLYSPMFKKVGMYISRGEIDSSKESLELNSDTKFARQQEAVKARVEVKEGCELTKSQVADLVLSNYIKRTIKHKELVEKCGKLLLPYLDKYHLDTEQFLKNLEEHDNDKFDDEIAPIYAVATQYNYNKDIRKMFTPVEGLMDKFEKVSWIKHYVRNEHHVAEHFSKHTPDGNVEYDLSNIDVSEKSPLALVEMMADWMAVGIEVGNTAGEWYKKCINEKKYKFSTKDAEMLKELIESEKEILDSEDVKELKYEIEEWRAKFDKNITMALESSSSLPSTINKDVQKILDDLKTFTYGLYVKDKSLITDPKKFHDYDPKDLLVQSPDSFEKNRCGMCHDATVYLNDKLSKLNVKFKCVYVESYKQPYMTTHSFVVAELVKGKWGIIDVFSYKSCLNQKVFSFWKEAVDERIVTWKEEEQADTDGYSAFIINSFPPHESNIDVFMKHMYKTGTEHRITYSTESLTPSMEASNIPAKKKQIIDFICKHCDIMDPSKFNSNRYREMLTNMSDRQFDDFMHKVKDKKYQLHLTAPNMKINLKIKDLLKCADSLKLKMFHRIWVKDKATGRRFLTDNEYLVLQLPVRRQEQIIDKKMSVPDNDKTIDGLTGQVSWESKATALTNPEIQILATRNMDASLYEFIKVRGGDINSYAEFKRSLEENGEARLNDLDPTARTRTSVMGGVLLTAMLLDSNL